MSVIVAAHNAAGCIGECLSSLVHQTYHDFEIIVVNDASTDDTRRIVQEAGIPNLRLIDLHENVGPADARNIAARHARGAYLAVLDADDVAMPQRLERQTGFLDQHPEIAMVGSYLNLESPDGKSRIAVRPLTGPKIRAGLSWSTPLANTSLMIRADVFRRVGGYPAGRRHGEDHRLLARVLREHAAANIAEVLVTKRESLRGLTFGISPFRHFQLALSHRIHAVRTVGLPFWHYPIAIVAAAGMLAVRWFDLDREDFKPQARVE